MGIVRLHPVNGANESDCRALRVGEDQEHLIASNTKSLEQAKSNPNNFPLAIYVDDLMVGFVLYEFREKGLSLIHRCMIDARYQRRGYGRGAMELLIRQIRQLGGTTIFLSIRPENRTAMKLYKSLGFVQHETEEDGEIIYRLGPRRELTPWNARGPGGRTPSK
jgi:diamine N-acetyltransferase